MLSQRDIQPAAVKVVCVCHNGTVSAMHGQGLPAKDRWPQHSAYHTLYCLFFSFSMMSYRSGSTSSKEAFSCLGHCSAKGSAVTSSERLIQARLAAPGPQHTVTLDFLLLRLLYSSSFEAAGCGRSTTTRLDQTVRGKRGSFALQTRT